MIGFVVNSETLGALEAGFAAAFTARGIPQYLTLGAVPINSGEHAGQSFIPFPDDALSQPLHGNHTLPDFPEFGQLIDLLGGMAARIDLPQESISPLSYEP